MPEDASTLPDVEAPAAKPAKTRATSARKPIEQSNQIDDVLTSLKDIQERVIKVERRLFWMMLSGWLKIFIIVVPIILGVLYLPPLIEDYKSLFSASANSTSLIEQFQELLGAPQQ